MSETTRDYEIDAEELRELRAEIERLQAVNAELLAVLEPFAKMADQVDEWRKAADPKVGFAFDADNLRRARAAIAKATSLEPKGTET